MNHPFDHSHELTQKALDAYEKEYERICAELKLTDNERTHVEAGTAWAINGSPRLFKAWLCYNAWRLHDAEMMRKGLKMLLSPPDQSCP